MSIKETFLIVFYKSMSEIYTKDIVSNWYNVALLSLFWKKKLLNENKNRNNNINNTKPHRRGEFFIQNKK